MNFSCRLWIEGQWVETGESRDIHAPFDGKVVAVAFQAGAGEVERASAATRRAFQVFKKSSRGVRSRLLLRMAQEIEETREKIIERMILEAGKPRTTAAAEVNRAVVTFTTAAEEAKRWSGDVIPLDLEASTRDFLPAQSLWVPRGPVLAITPFNFPLNLVAHKIAPALAVGATVVVKSAPQTPGCAVQLAEIFERAARAVTTPQDPIPLDAIQVLSTSNELTLKMVADTRFTTLSFTGSDRVGWWLQGHATRKKVLLELGGNAGVIIHSDADLARAAMRCASGGFGYAGQSCISVQRIFVQEKIYDPFVKLLLEETAKLKVGDPTDKEVTVGPMIDPGAAQRVEEWVQEATEKGAQPLTKFSRQGQVIAPVILASVPRDCKVSCEEVFGPVVVVEKYSELSEALQAVNASRFGLQAGIFTDSASLIQKTFDELDVGGVTINEIPTFRADHMPYGGVKDSGLGREGLRYAMEDYCERKTLVTWQRKNP